MNDNVIHEGWLDWLEILAIPPFGIYAKFIFDANALDKLISNKKFLKKLEPLVEKTVKQAKRENKDLTEDLPGGFCNRFAQGWKATKWTEDLAWDTGYPYDKYTDVAGTKLSKYYCIFILSNHNLKAIKVCLYDEKAEKNKYFPVEVPTDEYGKKYESTSVFESILDVYSEN